MNNKFLSWNERPDRDEIVRILSSGRVIAGASDTIPGLLVLPTQEGRRSLDVIKERANKSYLLLISSKNKLLGLVSSEQMLQIEKIVDQCWPGPLTLVLKAKPGLPKFLQSEEGTIAVRVPHHEGILEVLKNFPALFSTSANKAGQPVSSSIDSIDQDIKKEVSALVSNGPTSTTPSTILDCTQGVPELLRKGAYPVDQLEKIIGMYIRK